MTEVLQANIFFFITAISVVVFTLFLCVAAYHFIKILRTLRRIMDRVEEGTEVLADDFESVRNYFAEDGLLPRLMRTFMGASRGNERRRTTKHRKADLKVKDE